MEWDVTSVFDEVLGRHMERLIGSRFGIGGLRLTVGAIACLNLLGEQSDRTGEGDQNPDESTLEVLHAKLLDLGIREKEKADSLIRDMIAKGYILADGQGKVSGGKPAQSMARLIERAFPRMRGGALLAYFVQTIDEVVSGRKSPEAALSQFDQALKMQGAPVKGTPAEPAPKGAPKDEKKAENAIKGTITAFSARRSAEEERGGGRIIGSDGFVYRVEAAPPVASPAALPAEETAPDASMKESPQPDAVHAQDPSPPEGIVTEAPAVSAEAAPPPGVDPPQGAAEVQESRVQEEGPDEEQSGATAGEPPPPDAVMEGDEEASPEDEDDLVEKQVAEFQDELAASCPLCKTGKVRESQTGKGRVYYKCSNRSCNLVSWGRPHYQSCPHCGNPFLVECADTPEGVRLRCPRGTCSYRCTLPPGGVPPASAASPSPGPKRRLVRRRVVRRKK